MTLAALKLTTSRLDVVPWRPAALDALISADRARLEGLTGSHFPEPLAPPPLMDDVLEVFRDRLHQHPHEEGWWAWLTILRAKGNAVGSVGLGGLPDPSGTVVLGYSTYPGFEGRGYAAEAAGALLDWALAHSEVSRVRATIPPAHAASIRVATKLGLRRVDRAEDDEVGEVGVFELLAAEHHDRVGRDADAEGEARDERAQRRQRDAQHRTRAAEHRDREARRRDREADERDRLAELRAASAELTERFSGFDAAQVAMDRADSAADREAAEADRAAARDDRRQARADSLEAAADRSTAADDRQHAANERALADEHRRRAAANREQAATERGSESESDEPPSS